MYFVYILKSQTYQRYYIGSTENKEKRLSNHNAGKVKSTKSYKPWEIIRIEKYDTKTEALKRERQIKSYKGGNAFKKLIGL
jgi:putative endonuclease